MRVRLGVALLVVFLLVSRLLWLEADPWPRLDWSSGIWTDEGFYTYNARNAVLFGAARLDGFNNANLMPLLDLAQRLVFGAFGVHLVAARSLSVVASLLALFFFCDALRRGFGKKTALTGLALLGTDVFFWGYSRLALMELPATLVHCAAFWCLALGSAGGMFAAGLLAAATLAFKATYAIFLPVPLLAFGWARRRQGGPYLAGALVGLTLYAGLWGIPHRAEIAHMTNFYRTRQSQPRSVAEAGRCVSYALFGSQRNAKRYMVHCLETQAPVVTTVGLVGLFGLGWRRRRRDLLWRVLVVWAALGIGSLALTRYIPTRYLLLFLPALVGLAAVTLERLPALWRLWRLRPRRRLVGLGIPLFFLVDHLLASALTPRFGAGGAEWLAAGASLALVVFVTVRYPWQSDLGVGTAPTLVTLALVLNLGFVLHWAATRTYTLRDTSRTLGKLLPPRAVVIGEAAPLCLENRLRGIPVFYPGLANDKSPLQTFRPQYLMVTRVTPRLRYWNKNAPQVLSPANELVSFPLGIERLVLYKIPPEALP